MNDFRVLLLDIAQHLTRNDLDGLKFICSDFIPAGRAESLNKPHELFLELERIGKLSENNRDFLAVTLTKIGRNDLRNKLLGIPEVTTYDERQLNCETAAAIPREAFRQRLPPEINLEIYDKICSSWKFLGRYLNIPHHTISNIDDSYRRVEEKSYEMLNKWIEISPAPTAETLIRALEKCGRRDLVELVEDKVRGSVRPTENTFAPVSRQLLDMSGLQRNLPVVSNASRPIQEQKHPLEQEGQKKKPTDHEDAFTDRPNQRPVVDDYTSAARDPIQATDQDDLKKPGVLDNSVYEVAEQLGKGVFAKVFCVIEKRSHKYFAVKTIDLGENDSKTQEKVEAFKKEITLLTALDNPYVVKYYKVDSDSHLLALFMEYMPGNSIAKKVSTLRHLDQDVVRNYTWQLLKGLEYLHENKIIHRDVKGTNILLDKSEKHVKLSDFGISLCMEGIATGTGICMTSQKGLFASVFWTSPELLCSEKHSYNTDIWSLGCTVVEMLTGNPPFRTKDPVMSQVMYKISTCCVEPPEECSSLAKEFLDLCFQKKSERPSATDLLESSGFPTNPQPE